MADIVLLLHAILSPSVSLLGGKATWRVFKMQSHLDRFGSLLSYPTHFHYIWRSYFFSITYWFFPLFTFLAAQLNSNLCDKFSVGHYPMLFWGPPKKFVGGSWNPNQEKGDIISIDNGRTATLLLDWINKQLGRYTYCT